MTGLLNNREVKGFKCLDCMSTIYVDYFHHSQYNGRVPTPDSEILKRSDMCKCTKCCLILDLDGFVHIYVEDIKRVLLVDLEIVLGNVIERQILGTHNSFVFQDYSSIRKTPYNIERETVGIKYKSASKITKAFRKRNKD